MTEVTVIRDFFVSSSGYRVDPYTMAARAAKRARVEPLQTLLRRGRVSLVGLAELLQAARSSDNVLNVSSRHELRAANEERSLG
jgi:hypothetical protein